MIGSPLDRYLCSPRTISPPIEIPSLEISKITNPSPIVEEIRAFESLSIKKSVVGKESSDGKFLPTIRSGSHTDKGRREFNEDEHVLIDDLSTYLGPLFRYTSPSAFYGVFDGHGGSNAAAAYVKENVTKLLIEDADLYQKFDFDNSFLVESENSHCKAFLEVDQALADEITSGVPFTCGTTALTALVLGNRLLIANAGDCRAVLCRKGVPLQMSQDHRSTCPLEHKRVEDLGGYFEDGYLNGDLGVTRALGDWYMKTPLGSQSPLIAVPDFKYIVLTEEDEFLIVACDGIWDVMSNQNALSFVRRALRRHNDPKKCAEELVNEALRLNASDNLTALVVCFSSLGAIDSRDPVSSQRPRFKCCSLSEEATNKLRSLLEGN